MTTIDTTSAPTEVALLDIMDPTFRLDTPEVSAAREAHCYARTPVGAVVLRYAEAAELVRDRRFGQRGLATLAMQGVTDGPVIEFGRKFILFVEDDTHTRLRKLITRAFTPKRPPAVDRSIRGGRALRR